MIARISGLRGVGCKLQAAKSPVYVIIKNVGAPLVGARNDDGMDVRNTQRAGTRPAPTFFTFSLAQSTS